MCAVGHIWRPFSAMLRTRGTVSYSPNLTNMRTDFGGPGSSLEVRFKMVCRRLSLVETSPIQFYKFDGKICFIQSMIHILNFTITQCKLFYTHTQYFSRGIKLDIESDASEWCVSAEQYLAVPCVSLCCVFFIRKYTRTRWSWVAELSFHE